MRTFLVWLVAIVSVVSWGETPRPYHAKVLDAAIDCAVFQSLSRKSQKKLREIKARSARQATHVTERWTAFQNCVVAKGYPKPAADNIPTVSVQACLEEYQDWLKPGYRVLAYEEDSRALEDGLTLLLRETHYRCGVASLPTNYQVSPVKP